MFEDKSILSSSRNILSNIFVKLFELFLMNFFEFMQVVNEEMSLKDISIFNLLGKG